MTSRANVHVHQTNSGKSPKFVLSPALIFFSPISHYVCGVVFFCENILVVRNELFPSTTQICKFLP